MYYVYENDRLVFVAYFMEQAESLIKNCIYGFSETQTRGRELKAYKNGVNRISIVKK